MNVLQYPSFFRGCATEWGTDASAAKAGGGSLDECATHYPDNPAALAARFAVLAAGILFTGMALLGHWISGRTEHSVMQNSGQSLALIMESMIEPLVQELAEPGAVISEHSSAAIARLIDKQGHGQNITALRIWRLDGTQVYPRQGMPAPLRRADLSGVLRGHVQVRQQAAVLDDGGAMAHGAISIFAPLHRLGTGTLIAVAEYIGSAEPYNAAAAAARRDTWYIVASATFAMLALLCAVLYGGSLVISDQHKRLVERYHEQLRLNTLNAELQDKLQRARLESIEINEQFLRRVGADLHDGPAQLLALAMLRLEDVGRGAHGDDASADDAAEALVTVRRATTEAMQEIRCISAGLVVPEQQWRTPQDVIRCAVDAHERRTGDHITCHIGCLPAMMSNSRMVCLFRAVQETLNNAHRHAAGKGIVLRTQCDGHSLSLEVADSGPGFDVAQKTKQTDRLGLAGLRHRVESVGGKLHITSQPDAGTRVKVIFPASQSADFLRGCHVA